MKEIKLTQGRVAIVDDEDFEELNKYKWYFHVRYAMRVITIRSQNKKMGIKRKLKGIHMHREIIQTPDNYETDHIDGDGLNNQKSNLRICTPSQNTMNKNKYKNNTSGFKGVSFHKSSKKYQADIRINGKDIYLGIFDDPAEAAKAYDDAAKKIFGIWARLNYAY